MKSHYTIVRLALIHALLLFGLTGTAMAATLSPSSQTVNGTIGVSLRSSSLSASSFSGTVRYALAPSTLPTGLSFSTSSGQISGTPTVTQASTPYTITGTGSTSGSATATVTLTVARPAPTLSPSTQTISGTVGTSLRSSSISTNVGFSGTVTYSLAPSTLPTGLSFSTLNGQISGTPTVAQAATAYTITGSDGTRSATASVSLAVLIPKAAISPSTQTITSSVGRSLTSSALTANAGFSGTVTYALSPSSLPAGLAFSAVNGQISGTPGVSQATTIYTLTGTGGTSGVATATLTLTVTGISPATQTVAAKRGVAITPTSTLVATNFSGTVTYSISPALPAGLVMSSSTGVISGTSSLPVAATTFTITASDGKNTATAKASLSITDNCITPPAVTTAVREGRRAYMRMNCYSCHGADAKGGMGPRIVGSQVNDVVMTGASAGMPVFADYLCPNDISNLNSWLLYLENNQSTWSSNPDASFVTWWLP
jgi:mono/diheme cytochrome c family protein